MQTARPRVTANAQTSTSLLRAPAPSSTFVRGKSGYLPFRPGGLDDVVLADEEPTNTTGPKGQLTTITLEHNAYTKSSITGQYRTIPPGFSRGLDFGDTGAASENLPSSIPDAASHRTAIGVEVLLFQSGHTSGYRRC